MAFVKKIWTDRVAEFINRRLLTKEDGTTESVTVARSEGTVSTEGDGFNAKNMNDLEQRIADEFSALNDALNMRYNAETDMVEIYYNGAWHEWKRANLQTVYLYNEGEELVAFVVNSSVNSGWNAHASTKYETYVMLYVPNSGSSVFITAQTYDLSKFNKLKGLYVWNDTEYEIEVDISNVSSGYIATYVGISGSGAISTCLGVYSVNSLINTGLLAQAQETSASTVYLKKIWVE